MAMRAAALGEPAAGVDQSDRELRPSSLEFDSPSPTAARTARGSRGRLGQGRDAGCGCGGPAQPRVQVIFSVGEVGKRVEVRRPSSARQQRWSTEPLPRACDPLSRAVGLERGRVLEQRPAGVWPAGLSGAGGGRGLGVGRGARTGQRRSPAGPVPFEAPGPAPALLMASLASATRWKGLADLGMTGYAEVLVMPMSAGNRLLGRGLACQRDRTTRCRSIGAPGCVSGHHWA